MSNYLITMKFAVIGENPREALKNMTLVNPFTSYKGFTDHINIMNLDTSKFETITEEEYNKEME